MTKNEKDGDSKDGRILPPFPAPSLSELVGQDNIQRQLFARRQGFPRVRREPEKEYNGDPPGSASMTSDRGKLSMYRLLDELFPTDVADDFRK